jgi:hypothetical protein
MGDMEVQQSLRMLTTKEMTNENDKAEYNSYMVFKNGINNEIPTETR